MIFPLKDTILSLLQLFIPVSSVFIFQMGKSKIWFLKNNSFSTGQNIANVWASTLTAVFEKLFILYILSSTDFAHTAFFPFLLGWFDFLLWYFFSFAGWFYGFILDFFSFYFLVTATKCEASI